MVYVITQFENKSLYTLKLKIPKYFIRDSWYLCICLLYSGTCQTNNQRGQRETIPDLNFMLLKKNIAHEEETINS